MKPFRRNKKPQQNQPPQQPKSNYAFIDSQNLNLGIQKMGWKLDWRKFRQYLKDAHNVEKAYMFIGYLPDNEKLYDQMHELGYLIVLKPTLEMYDTEEKQEAREKKDEENRQERLEAKQAGEATAKEVKPEEKRVTKGNVDAELVLYAVKEMPNYHKAVVVSGDGDFFSLVEYLDQQKKLQNLLAPNWQYSSLLKPFESYIIRLDQKRRELSYKGFHKKPTK